MCDEHKKILKKITAGFIVLVLANILPFPALFKSILILAVYLFVGIEVLTDAVKDIGRGGLFDEEFLMSLATVGALCLGEFNEAAAVMLLYQLGELFGDIASDSSRNAISRLVDLAPETANLWDGKEGKTIPSRKLQIGDIIVIKAGEKVPADGIITEGETSVNTSALTGESMPLDVKCGDKLCAGFINCNGVIKMRVESEYDKSAAAKIVEMIENAAEKKSQSEKFINRFAKIYTPVIIVLAVLILLIPTMINPHNFRIWLKSALSFLVVSCPCALVISVPLAFFNAVGRASKKGVLIKGSNYLEMLSKTQYVAFDKTGTITKGNFAVTEIVPKNISAEELKRLAVLAEHDSNHPIAKAICALDVGEIDLNAVTRVEETAGFGIKAVIGGDEICVGSKRMIEQMGLRFDEVKGASAVYISKNNEYVGYLLIEDEIKEDSAIAIKNIKDMGVRECIMLTGDSEETASRVCREVGIDKFFASLLPDGKVKKLEEIMENTDEGKFVCYAGDGINDAPVIMRADIGVSMGALGSDAAIEASDVVITHDNLSALSGAIMLSKNTMKIVKQNIAGSLIVKFLMLALISVGFANMWLAIFADVGVMILAILNSLRIKAM